LVPPRHEDEIAGRAEGDVPERIGEVRLEDASGVREALTRREFRPVVEDRYPKAEHRAELAERARYVACPDDDQLFRGNVRLQVQRERSAGCFEVDPGGGSRIQDLAGTPNRLLVE